MFLTDCQRWPCKRERCCWWEQVRVYCLINYAGLRLVVAAVPGRGGGGMRCGGRGDTWAGPLSPPGPVCAILPCRHHSVASYFERFTERISHLAFHRIGVTCFPFLSSRIFIIRTFRATWRRREVILVLCGHCGGPWWGGSRSQRHHISMIHRVWIPVSVGHWHLLCCPVVYH